MKSIAIIAVAAALSLTGCGAGATVASDAKPSHPTKTVTETETVETEVTPDACLEALDKVEELRQEVVEFTEIAGRYLPLIQKAYVAGANGSDPESILREINTNTAANEDLNDRTGKTMTAYQAAADECRNH